MAINIPLPDPDKLGDGFWRAYNSIMQDDAKTKEAQLKNQYYPITAQADAASKIAYSSLMGPQYMAKLMGNQDFLANTPDQQKAAILQKLLQAGMSQGSGTNVFSQAGAGQVQPSQHSFSNFLVDKIKGIFGSDQPNQGQRQPVNALVYGYQQPQISGLSAQDRNAVNNMQPGDSYVVQGDQAVAQPQPQAGIPNPNQPSTFAENTGSYKGIVQEGEEAGKIRAKDIDELNTTVFNAETHQTTLDDISGILSSPEFEQIRQVPLLGHHELAYYSKEGTPAQQNMVGRYFSDTGNVIKDSARDFAGQFRKGEQQLLNGMKPNPSDTVDTARGKLESLSYFNKMLSQRSRLTSQIMSKYHVNKLQAQEQADKQINGEQIRQDIHDKLNPTVTIRNRKTGETKTISAGEARSLGVPNV